MARSLALVLSLLCASALAADVAQPCVDGQPPNFNAVQVIIGDKECTSLPCPLVRGSVARSLISFTTNNTVTSITQKIIATELSSGITTPFPVPDADKGCSKLQGSFCPLDSGETAVIELAFDVLKIYPKVPLELAISLLDQNKIELACFRLRGEVVDP